ncbi:MAG: hypothetical protein K2K97_05260 [Muribaculaceae bacterium]|nr:hypothetical protein [Muribaculaceae bacterium]
MIIKLKKKNIVFRNPSITALDAKMVPLDHVLTNLFQLIAANGATIKLGKIKGKHTVDSLKGYMVALERQGLISGVSENMEAVEDWIRANLVSMVYRGNVVKEKVSSLRPMHLMSYRIQNRAINRDYNASDQIFMMLKESPEVLKGLYSYMSKGWDKDTNRIIESNQLDVDTVGILLLSKNISEKKTAKSEIDDTKPLLKHQTEIFNDDVRRLLVYQDLLPRTVFMEYLRILIGFHLSLYEMKLISLLPKMREQGTTQIADDWSMVIDMTEDLDSGVSAYAVADMERLINMLNRYFKATFEINVIQNRLKNKNVDASVEACLHFLKYDLDRSDSWYERDIDDIINEVGNDEETVSAIKEMLQFFDDDDYFGKYIHLLENTSGGSNYQYKYHLQCLDKLTMKNSESMLTASGVRSRRHPRRGAMGSKLLETIVQLLVLKEDGKGAYTSNSLSIEELAKKIRQRYGLIINGIDEPRFVNADVQAHAAFKENMDAFRNKLRQIGFYSDLSDACILQKIRPRYKIDD